MLGNRLSYYYNKMAEMTYEAVQVLVRLGDSSGRESRSAPRRSMDSLNRDMSGLPAPRELRHTAKYSPHYRSSAHRFQLHRPWSFG